MDIRHDKSDHFKTKRRRKRQLYSSRSANTRWPPLIRPGSKYIPHVSSVHGIALQPATPDNIFASNHYYLLPATQPHHATTPSGNPFQNYKSGPPAVLDLKSYFQLPNDPAPNSIIQPGPPLSQYKTNVPNATPNPIPLSTQPVGNISPGPWTAATSQDRTTLLAMRPKTQMKLYTPIADYTTQPSSIKGFPKLAHLANYNKDETVIPDESKGHPRNGSRVDATNQEPPPKKPQNRHRDEQKQTQHHYPESIRHHAETERLAESFENGANSESEGEAEAENEEADVSSGSNEAPLDFNPKRGRHKNIPLKILRNKLRNFNSHFSDPKFERYMNRLNFKMNDFPNHKPESSAEFPNPQSGKPFDFSTEDDEGDIGIDPQLLFTTPDTKNIGSFTPTPRPKPTKKPKNAITPLGISPAYAPANYSYPLNYGHKKTTKPYEPQDSTETYDDTEDGTSYPVTVPGTYTKDDDCVEYDDAKDGLTSYLSNNPPGHYYNSYPRHKSPDESSNYYPTPSGFPSKPRVKQKPEPEQEDNDEYYDDNEQYNDDGKKENPDEAEEYYDGYDDEEYAEDYKHEKPSKLISGSSVKPPRAPKMLQHLDSHTKPPSVNLSDAEYYDDEYYEDDEYYDETVTNKVTQPGPRRTTDKIRRNMTSITSDPLSQSSIDNYAIIKSSPSYHRRTRIHPGNTTKNDNLLEHTSPLNELSENNSPSYPATTTSHYLTKPKMRKKTTRYYQNLNSTTPNSLSVNSAFEQTNYKSDLISTPQVDTNSSGVNNFTISPKYRKNRQKLKNYATRNRNLPTQNTTESVVETGYRNSDRGRQNSLQFGGKSSLKNHRMPEETRPTDWNLLPFDKKSSNKIPPIPSSSSSNQKQFEDHTDNDEYKLPANHKILPSAGRLLTNPRAKLRQNLKQQKLINSPSNGQATDRVSVAPPNYIPQQQSAQVTASVSNRGIYNGTQYNPQQQQQFDSYYNLYNDESELYGDDVIFKVRQPKFSSATRKSALKSRNSKNYYGQYQVPNRGKHQPQIEIVQRLPEKNAVAYTPVQSYKTQENAYTPSYKTQGNVAYTPSYKQKQPDIYNVDDYNQQYSLQAANDDLSYQQPGLIGNKPSSIRLVPAGNESKVNETKQPLFPKSSTSHELNQQPSQRITLSAAFSLDNSPNSQLVQNPSTRVRPSSNFFIVKDNDDLPKPYQVSDLPDSFSNKKDIKNIEITRMRASGKSVPSRGTPKPTSSPTTFVVPTFPSRKQLNITAFSTDDPNFRIVVDPVKANKQSLVSPIGFKILDPTTKSNTPATFGTSHRDRVFKPRPFSPSEWIENINFTTEASPPQSNTHRFERVNFEKEIAELTKSGPSFLKAPVDFTTEGEFYRSGQGFSRTPIQYVTEGEPSRGASSFSKAPVQFTTEATTSRIAIRIPPKPATKIEQSTKKLDVTNTVSRFISDLSFTTKKPERGRPKLEGNDIQQFSTPSTTARYWASSKADSNLPGKAFPSKVEAKPTETSDFQGRSFFSSKNSPQTQNANAPSLHNSDNKPSRFDEVLDDEEYYDDDYYDDDELENDKLLPSSSPSTKALPPSTTQTPPKPSPFTYKPSIKIPVTSSPKEYSNPSKSGTRTLTRENEVSNVKESPLNPCSEGYERNSECNEKPLVRVRPTSASPESQASLDFTRGRQRGSATYTTASSELDRGTPLSSGGRPTLKPSNSIVSKASEFVDIYKFPPKRPDAVYPTPQVDKTAAKCRKDVCLLPDCYCGGKEVPGDLQPEETPQIVLLTFDDSVNDLNKGLYSDLFEKGRTNPNGCPISATFYVSHEWTDYSQVQNLYSAGHEIASHSVSHSFGEQFSQKKWTREIAGQREILSAYGGVKLEDIRGMRAPFLAVGGNKMFKMLFDSNFTYDSSMPVYENRPPSWPYTLDYKIFHDCMIPPCPTRSYPGVWEVPMVMWQDLNGGRCSMGDACSNPPTSDGVYKMLIKNFERHFTTNRAPFGLFYHAAWFTQPHHKEGFIAFLDTIVNMPEVWVVTNWQALQWVRDPTPISRLRNFTPFGCDYQDRPRRCNNPKVCNLWHKSGVRYMRTCQPCPEIYPWTGKTGIRNSKVDNEIIQD